MSTVNANHGNPPPVIISSVSAADLIQIGKSAQPDFVIESILGCGDILVLHGFEETFKSVIVVHMAADIAAGTPFLDWRVPLLSTPLVR
jgi:hypothetical protein